MVANIIYIVVLVSVVIIFLLIPVGLLARMIFNKVDTSMTAEELADMEEHIKNLLDELRSVSQKSIERLEEQQKKLNELVTLAGKRIGELNGIITSAKEIKTDKEPGGIKSDLDGLEAENMMHVKIEKLFSSGMAVDDIAREVNMHKGEIQLILGLREFKGSQGKTVKRVT